MRPATVKTMSLLASVLAAIILFPVNALAALPTTGDEMRKIPTSLWTILALGAVAIIAAVAYWFFMRKKTSNPIDQSEPEATGSFVETDGFEGDDKLAADGVATDEELFGEEEPDDIFDIELQ